eukprot:CAMPEP_0114500554 /NCGR_PEP_ID=MMETSP0109-20121206/8025_1 /TAXON_ID=29199 /ORGANISM="Chlorarachnion reptans, Strain CCCM449" /LENGTH=303 /DNA_ID=CAMNT_0001678221 /DNA_START=57 /DNA_END=968 /DNA_ORIENTATION=+
MATRNRTRVFLQFRNSNRGRADSGLGLGEGSDSQFLDKDEMGKDRIDRNSLPPEWVDIVERIEDELKAVSGKMMKLDAAYEARLKVSFSKNRLEEDQNIDVMTQEITRIFRKTDNNLKRIATIGNPEAGAKLPMQERVVRLNVMRSLAKRIQASSKSFKNKQKQFMMRKKNQENAGNEFFDAEAGDEVDSMLTDEQQLEMIELDRRADQRQKDIDKIVESVRELNQIFREMSILVVEQGTVLDRIDYQIELTHQRVVAGNVELEQANKYSVQASKKFWWCFGILLVLIIILLGIVINKFQHKN